MGLDVTAWRRLERCADRQIDDVGVHVYASNDFPGRTEGLADGCYNGERRAFGEWHSFRAGSYSGYGMWRDWLAQFADAADADAGPFFELINFYDNEGFIGPVVSAKLAKDFAAWDAHVAADADACRAGYYSLYVLWRAAFEWAADGGCVELH